MMKNEMNITVTTTMTASEVFSIIKNFRCVWLEIRSSTPDIRCLVAFPSDCVSINHENGSSTIAIYDPSNNGSTVDITSNEYRCEIEYYEEDIINLYAAPHRRK